MIKLETPMGELFIRSSEILAVSPEVGRPGCSLIYCQLFPEGISINKTTPEIVQLIVEAELEFEYEIDEETESDEEE